MSTTSVKLIVGLGNPGPEYEQTRHNVGMWLVDLLARKYGGSFRYENKFDSLACRISVNSESVWLLKPQTFMNRSGFAVAPFARFYKLQLPSILLCHDELDLSVGSVRIKRSGGAGGHNGLRSVLQQLSGDNFLRLRIGIGHPGQQQQVLGYVLRAPPSAEKELLDEAINQSFRMMPDIVTGKLEKAMNVLHSRSAKSSVSATG